jgi:glycosyltransferase involved in cell wall biosynthesis
MKRNLRILHVGPDIEARGGIASVLRGLSEHAPYFSKLAVDFAFLSTTPQRSGSRSAKSIVFAHALYRLARQLLRSKVDIVHIHTAIRGSLIRKSVMAGVCALLGSRYILQIHNGAFVPNYQTRSKMGRHCIRLLLRYAAGVIVLSKHSSDALINLGLVTPAQCHIVFNGIVDPLNGESLKRGHNGDVVNITFLGLICPDKGVPSLISAIADMDIALPEFFVRLAGIGEVEALQESIIANELGEIVKYVGWLDGEKKASLLSRTDIFVLPSRSEGFSVAIVEAMAYGAAILSTTIPGVVDVVRGGIDGILTEPDDISAITAALEWLITDFDTRARFGASARQRFLDTFTFEEMAAHLSSVYCAVQSEREI